MPCAHCKTAQLRSASPCDVPIHEDLPVRFHPVAFPLHHAPAMAWREIWDDPKICGGCGSWFSEPLPLLGPRERRP